MHVDPLLPSVTLVLLVAAAVAIVSRLLRQPHVITYIVAGVLIGPDGLKLVTSAELIAPLGAVGVVLLLFFIGMHLDLAALVSRWHVMVGGTILQILISVAAVWVLGSFLGWSPGRVVMLGFVISLSSTAVVIQTLQSTRELHSPLGRDVIGITLAQDMAVAPMLIVLSLLAGDRPSGAALTGQIVGAAGIVVALVWIARVREVRLPSLRIPFGRRPVLRLPEGDQDIRVLLALLSCFGLAMVTSLLGLSAALGAFVAGVLVAALRQTDWIRNSLEPFYVVFVGLFFVSVGMILDLEFLWREWWTVARLVILVLITNTLINATIMHVLGVTWRGSIYAGSVLAQIGEFSFVLCAVGLNVGVISEYGYQATISTIAITLLVGPMYIYIVRRLTGAAAQAAA